jgi:hypothetical protein
MSLNIFKPENQYIIFVYIILNNTGFKQFINKKISILFHNNFTFNYISFKFLIITSNEKHLEKSYLEINKNFDFFFLNMNFN